MNNSNKQRNELNIEPKKTKIKSNKSTFGTPKSNNLNSEKEAKIIIGTERITANFNPSTLDNPKNKAAARVAPDQS